jgi:hypothetical protein
LLYANKFPCSLCIKCRLCSTNRSHA